MAIDQEKRRITIESLRQLRDDLRTEYNRIGDELRAVEEALKALDRHQPIQQSLQLSPTPKYSMIESNIGAVEEFLKDHPDGEFRASEIANNLKDLGYKNKDKRVLKPSTVSNCLTRLIEKGVAERKIVPYPAGKKNRKREGTFFFFFKKAPLKVENLEGRAP